MSANDIINYYLEHSDVTNKCIADKFSVSPQYVGRVLKEVKNKEDTRKKILEMFYCNKNLLTDIGNELDISLPSIRKILKEHDEKKFAEEKEKRKERTHERNKEKRRVQASAKLEGQEDARIMSQLDYLQRLCAREDSRSSQITAADMIRQNRQHYSYDSKKETYRLIDMDCEVPQGLPRVYRVTGRYATISGQKDPIREFIR